MWRLMGRVYRVFPLVCGVSSWMLLLMVLLRQANRPVEKLGYALLVALVGLVCWIYQRRNNEATKYSKRGMQLCVGAFVVVGLLFLVLSRWNIGIH